jgi:hypothetical protein
VPAQRPYLHVVANPEDELVGFREAIQRGILMELVREANGRYPDANSDDLERYALQNLRAASKATVAANPFPTSKGYRGTEKLYRVGDLQYWERNRPRAVNKAVNG